MKERTCFFTKEQSLLLRGIGIVLVILSHYGPWYADVLQNEALVYGISRLGVYGVDLFFLASGYGLVKSVQKKKDAAGFWIGRLKNTYLPYLCIAGAIELAAGGISSAKGWYRFLTGYDYWFIRNILIFYIIFFAVFWAAQKRWLRAALMAVFVFGYSWWLVSAGRSNFWYVSNIAFVLGIFLAQYEKELMGAFDFGYFGQLALGALLLCLAAKSGMDARTAVLEPSDKIKYGVAASAVWSLFCAQAARLLPADRRAGGYAFFAFLRMLGRISLELYLLHSFLYYRVTDQWTQLGRGLQALCALALTLAGAWVINRTFAALWKAGDGWKRRRQAVGGRAEGRR